MKWPTRFVLIAAAVAVSACANKQHSTDNANTAHSNPRPSATTPASNGSICRAIPSTVVNQKGKNDAYLCQANISLNSQQAQKALTSSVKVSYGSTSGETLVSRQISNAVGKTPDQTCQQAFLGAVKRFQATAERKNKSSVRLVSYFDKKVVAGHEYECHIGTWNSRVVLQGSFH